MQGGLLKQVFSMLVCYCSLDVNNVKLSAVESVNFVLCAFSGLC